MRQKNTGTVMDYFNKCHLYTGVSEVVGPSASNTNKQDATRTAARKAFLCVLGTVLGSPGCVTAPGNFRKARLKARQF